MPEILETLKQIRENCRKTKCKECKYYVCGSIVDKCLFDDMPMDWELYKLKEVKQCVRPF